VTIISDQDKGSTGAVKEIFKEAFHFHCSWHRRQNITTKFGNKDGTAELSANWMFNVLSNCKTHRAIKMKGDTYFHGMTAIERNYLRKLPDSVQYPAACCAMGADVCMYGRSASSGVESMNRANKKEVRNHTAVDALNGAMRMVRIEARRFESYKELAWSQTLPLTPRGMDEMEAVFSELNTTHYNCDIQEMERHFLCTVCKVVGESVTYSVTIPKHATQGSFFGTCNCGIPKRDGIPCVHMAVLVDGGDIPNPEFTRVTVMPYWWRTDHWRTQFPQDVTCIGSVNLRLIMSKYNPEGDIRYFPDWLAPNKAGRPKKNQRKIGVADHIANMPKKRRKRMFCTFCQKFNHNDIDCFQNPINARAQDDEPEAADMNVDGQAGWV
jgi:hypothetical protein